MPLTRKQWLLVLLSVTGLFVAALMYARRPQQVEQGNAPQASTGAQQPVLSAAYADPSVCSSCHDEIARTYSLTGMGRSFSRVRPGSAFVGAEGARVYHRASDRHYAMSERDGKLFQRRHQIGFGGRETNALELEAHYVVGSGNHARTFLHRNADGRLVQLPVSWYAEARPATTLGTRLLGDESGLRPAGASRLQARHRRGLHVLSQRLPARAAVEDRLRGSPSLRRYREARLASLPEGIDCQRCHGPGQAHVDAVKAGDLEAGLRAIVNPAKLDRDRQLETCMQCHLESTSTPLPFQIQRYEQPPFSYIAGKGAERLLHPLRSRARRPAATTSSRSPAAPTACASRRAFSAAR